MKSQLGGTRPTVNPEGPGQTFASSEQKTCPSGFVDGFVKSSVGFGVVASVVVLGHGA